MPSIEELKEQGIIEVNRFQPLMAVSNERLECSDCGALAIYVLFIACTNNENATCFYCQSCFEHMKEETNVTQTGE